MTDVPFFVLFLSFFSSLFRDFSLTFIFSLWKGALTMLRTTSEDGSTQFIFNGDFFSYSVSLKIVTVGANVSQQDITSLKIVERYVTQ